jgi:hypothetical protein
MIGAVVHPSDLIGLKTGDSLQLSMPSDDEGTTTNVTH